MADVCALRATLSQCCPILYGILFVQVLLREVGPSYAYFLKLIANQCFHIRPCQNADTFNSSDEDTKRKYSEVLCSLLCIAHVLPLAQKSQELLKEIYNGWQNEFLQQHFHKRWTLDGWNDHIIQPARDAVLEYYKVRTKSQFVHWLFIQWYQRYAKEADVEEYMRLGNLS